MNELHTQPVYLTPKQHQARHKVLFDALDELTADYINHHQDSQLAGLSVMMLVNWSNEQQGEPTP